MEPPVMSPPAAGRLVRFVGDSVSFSIARGPDVSPAAGWQARLRTTLGRGRVARAEIIQAGLTQVPAFGARWHDIPLTWDGTRWHREIVLAEPGFFPAKPYLIDPRGYQVWPQGPDAGVSVHPDWARTGNILYCAFTRLFGVTRTQVQVLPVANHALLKDLEAQGYATLPPSGTFRNLAEQLPHIVEKLGCRILHLLPVHPTPTTFARFGRMGSPYAALDLTAVDPALVEFDQRTTGVQQFEELTRKAHSLGARVFLDIVINHTGWGSRLHEESPEFFRREPDGRFASPGAWGVTWEDLVELEPHDRKLWDILAESLLTWCRRGVDGFRCDAGYKVPTPVWQYIAARIHDEFPDTVLFLEGLGGSWDATENLLTEGGMQWAYSELFQNDSAHQIQSYLDYALRQSDRVGTYVHFSETHDNNRLAIRGRNGSLFRNQLCALTSIRGGFGFTCGVEWLAPEKILVHQCTGLAWDSPSGIVSELEALNRLLCDHPAFFDGAEISRISPEGSPVVALWRRSADHKASALILLNPSSHQTEEISIPVDALHGVRSLPFELLNQPPPSFALISDVLRFRIPPESAFCLSPDPAPPAGSGTLYRETRARVAWAVQKATALAPAETIPNFDPPSLSQRVARNPARWLAELSAASGQSPSDIAPAFLHEPTEEPFPCVITWREADLHRVVLVPPGWWLLVRLPEPFRAHLQTESYPTRSPELHASSIAVDGAHVAAFPPNAAAVPINATLRIEKLASAKPPVSANLRLLNDTVTPHAIDTSPNGEDLVLLTNQRGGMARFRVDFGGIRSKYDAALAANLHPSFPVDRHVFVKRVRAWLNADGFISPLDRNNLIRLDADPTPTWTFRVNAGDGRSILVQIEAVMPAHRNTVLLRFRRTDDANGLKASLTLRVDLEDRSFHAETHRNLAADHHFQSHSHAVDKACGFDFTPAPDRQVRVTVSRGQYHPNPEWSQHVSHPIEATRGQIGAGDAWSPGWFEVPLPSASESILILDADSPCLPDIAASALFDVARGVPASARRRLGLQDRDVFAERLAIATNAYLARRDSGRTVIAGYPWFLDWGRDTLIAARGLLAAGWRTEVLEILQTFGRFADRGTLPNSIHGDNATNRDTSDAPLWFVRVLDEMSRAGSNDFLNTKKNSGGASLLDVAISLVSGYLEGTPNGIRVDPDSALVWSPSHFTWMDTNHPAGTPREGYPIEIQALWIAALQFLGRTDPTTPDRWRSLASKASESFHRCFWIDELGWFSDVLLASPGTPASSAIRDTALRCNMLLPISFGLTSLNHSRRAVAAALSHLVVPGAVRSLAPLPVHPPLVIQAPDGRALNDPVHPYWGRYEGDEDSRRKPAYHNGTAWTWFLPVFCEAFATAWNHRPEALRAARAFLLSSAPLLDAGCLGHLPEILDGDAPHTDRGCDAQAWSVTESLRVWLHLTRDSSPGA